MKIDARLTFDRVRFDQENTAHLVLSLSAPAFGESASRPKLAIIVCVDTSSSMGGRKLEYARMSILKMIDHLKPDDRLGIVAFSSAARIIAPLNVIGQGKDSLRKLVGGLYASGSTNFAGGMLQSIEMLSNADLGSNYLQRIIMFTDGEANTGPAKTAPEVIKLFKANAPDHITASAFGYGTARDFDPEFLASFAKEAKGNYAHVEDPDKALKAFGTELGGLISTYATGLSIEVSPLAGHKIERVISDVDAEEKDVTGEVQIQIPDLLAEETRHVVLEVKLAPQKNAGPRSVNVFEVRGRYDTFDSLGKKESAFVESKAKVQFVKEGSEQTKATDTLDDIVGLAQLVRAQLEAESQAKAGNFAGAQKSLADITTSFSARGRERLAAVAHNLQSRVESQASYSANEGYLRSFSRGATRAMGVSSYADGSEVALQSLGLTTNNALQTEISDSFTAGGVLPEPAEPWSVVPPVDTSGGLQVSGANIGAATISPLLSAQGSGYVPSQVSTGVSLGNALPSYYLPNVSLSNASLPNPVLLGTTTSPAEESPVKSEPKAKKPKKIRQTKSKKTW